MKNLLVTHFFAFYIEGTNSGQQVFIIFDTLMDVEALDHSYFIESGEIQTRTVAFLFLNPLESPEVAFADDYILNFKYRRLIVCTFLYN